MGPFNSSETRIRPFFRALRELDSTGKTWLPQLLFLAPLKTFFAGNDLLFAPGTILQIQLDPERKLLPPEAFLEWLIQNPGQMTWPKGETYSRQTQRWREMLTGHGESSSDLEAQETSRTKAQRAALGVLGLSKAKGSRKRWWAFEGETCVDCFIETTKMRIYIEGKRNESLSKSTAWFPKRNQLMRNIESASQDSGPVPFVNLMMAESSDIPISDPAASWPHLSMTEREELLNHFLGVVTWREACLATGVNYETLPDSMPERRQSP